LDRVLNAGVLVQIEELLGGAATIAGPLERLAARYPEVTADTLEEVVAAFHSTLEDALAVAPDGRSVRLTQRELEVGGRRKEGKTKPPPRRSSRVGGLLLVGSLPALETATESVFEDAPA
jgi:hypothetical protein